MAGTPGFEPGNAGIKTPCLTTWRRPNCAYYSKAWCDVNVNANKLCLRIKLCVMQQLIIDDMIQSPLQPTH